MENEEKDEKMTDDSMNADNDNETFKDILNMSDNILDSIMNEGDSSVKTSTSLMEGEEELEERGTGHEKTVT